MIKHRLIWYVALFALFLPFGPANSATKLCLANGKVNDWKYSASGKAYFVEIDRYTFDKDWAVSINENFDESLDRLRVEVDGQVVIDSGDFLFIALDGDSPVFSIGPKGQERENDRRIAEALRNGKRATFVVSVKKDDAPVTQTKEFEVESLRAALLVAKGRHEELRVAKKARKCR